VSAGAPASATDLLALAIDLVERDAWSRERLLAHQQAELRDLIAHAVARSPYYREVLPPDAPDRPVTELPTLPKAKLMEEWDRIVCDPRLRRAAVEDHAAGPAAAEPYLGEFQIFSTSGASGIRGVFAYDASEWSVAIASTLRPFLAAGIREHTSVAGIGAPGGVHMSKRVFDAGQDTSNPAPDLSVLTPLPRIVEALNSFQPEALVGYPSIAGLLAAEQRRGRLRIAPRILAFGSEPLTDETRAAVRDAWGIEPAEYYTATELPIIASSTLEHPRALELAEDLAVIEVVDEQNRPAPPGVPGAKVLITNLFNRTLPLIRYELDDRVTLAPGPNPAERPFRHLSRVDGRAAEVLTLPRAGGGSVDVPPVVFGGALARLPAVGQSQVVCHPDRIEVRVVLESTDAAPAVEASVREALARAGAVPPSIDVISVSQLERDPGPAAKLRLVKLTSGGGRPQPSGS
jgi:phenylacetate-CoA ligase